MSQDKIKQALAGLSSALAEQYSTLPRGGSRRFDLRVNALEITKLSDRDMNFTYTVELHVDTTKEERYEP